MASIAAERAARARSADPYRDTDVIDSRAPRVNQGAVALVTILALILGASWLVALQALQLIVGLTLGRRFCLACVAYFELVQPRIGEGELEDSRPPRFANAIGAAVLSAATIGFLAGVPALGWALTGLVAALASLAATTGFCLGCAIHRRIYGRCEVCDLPGRSAAAASR